MNYNQRNNSFTNHHDFQHYVLLYNDTKSRDDYLINYINQGLNKNELCIYASVGLRDKDTLKFVKRIVDYEKNISENNLILVDLAPFYIAALTYDFRVFKETANEFSEKIKNRENKNIRFSGDGAGLLYDNKHFALCESIESWWHHQRPFEGIVLCPYQKSNLEKYPFNLHKDNAIGKQHDNFIDAESILNKDRIANNKEINSSKEINNKEDRKEYGGSNR